MKGDVINPLDGETWKPVEGWPRYEVSNLGRVKSLMRQNKVNVYPYPHLLSLKPNSKGYHYVRLYESRYVFKEFPVHRLVASHFIQKPDGYKEVHHIDNNKLNNVYTNLMWVTRLEHMEFTKRETAWQSGLKGEMHGCAKLKNTDVIEIRRRYIPNRVSLDRLAMEFRTTKQTIWRIVHKKAWKHI